MTLLNIFVDNLSSDVEEMDLEQLFEEYGEVASVNVVREKVRTFAFVAMPDKTQGLKAINELDGRDFMGLDLKVSEARTEE